MSDTAYDLTGPADAPVIALIHGLGLSRRLWDAHLPDFAGYRVLNYDLYGHGDSAPPPATASLSVYAAQLSRLLIDQNIKSAHVFGFSIGGMINRRFALDYPDQVASLTILNSPHDRGETAQKAVEDRAASVRDQGAFSTFDAALQRWFTPECLHQARARTEGGEDEVAPARGGGAGAGRAASASTGYMAGSAPDLVRAWRAQVDPESYAQAAWVLANGVRELIAPATPITAPTLVMTCENDSGSTPKMSHDIAAEIPGARTHIIPHLQHLGLMERPRAFTTPILEFLESLT